jgi:hypothetical protein
MQYKANHNIHILNMLITRSRVDYSKDDIYQKKIGLQKHVVRFF